jgi:hypothetical protein
MIMTNSHQKKVCYVGPQRAHNNEIILLLKKYKVHFTPLKYDLYPDSPLN